MRLAKEFTREIISDRVSSAAVGIYIAERSVLYALFEISLCITYARSGGSSFTPFSPLNRETLPSPSLPIQRAPSIVGQLCTRRFPLQPIEALSTDKNSEEAALCTFECTTLFPSRGLCSRIVTTVGVALQPVVRPTLGKPLCSKSIFLYFLIFF